jgi:hypothetical protein
MTTSNKKKSCIMPVIVLAIIGWFVFSPGGWLRQQKAIETVKSYLLTIHYDTGSQAAHPLEELVRFYNIDKGTLNIGDGVVQTNARSVEIPWKASYRGGKFVVECEWGRPYSFETDLIYVTPVNDAAKKIFELPEKQFAIRR